MKCSHHDLRMLLLVRRQLFLFVLFLCALPGIAGAQLCAPCAPCNQVCNPGFAAAGFCAQFPGGCPTGSPCHLGNCSPFEHALVNCWVPSHGTPQIFGCPGNTYANMWHDDSNGEGIVTAVNVVNGRDYIFSYRRRKHVDPPTLVTEALDNVLVSLVQSTSAGGTFPNTDNQCGNTIPVIAPEFPVLHETNLNVEDLWETVTVCFTNNSGQDYDRLWIYPRQIVISRRVSLHVDDVVLIEDNFSAGPDATIFCGPLNIGAALCDFPGATYLWTVVSGDAGSIIGAATNATATVNPNQTTVYRLTRTITTAGSNTTPDRNCPQRDDLVTVTVLPCIDNDPCTTDGCVNNQCIFTPIICNDFDPCTIDACVNGLCVYTSTNPTITAVTVNSDCAGLIPDGSVTVTVTGGIPPYTYTAGPGFGCLFGFGSIRTVGPTNATTVTIPNLWGCTYPITVIGANGCIASTTATIPIAPVSTPVVTTTPDGCTPACTGTATIANPIPLATYTWSDGSTGTTIGGLCVGAYRVTVTTIDGCTATTSFNIGNPPPIFVRLRYHNHERCPGACDGSAEVLGGPNHTYVWSNGVTTARNNILCPGTHTVTITDANTGCFIVRTVTILRATQINVRAIFPTDVSCNGGNDGSAWILLFGGTPPYTFNWSSGSSQNPVTNLTAGTHTVTITDANGCTTSRSVTISEPPPIMITMTPTPTNCNASTGSISVQVTGGTTLIPGVYTYVWNTFPPRFTPNISGLPAGNYCVTVIDANGCTASQCATVPTITNLTVSLTPTHVTCHDGSNGSITTSVSGGTPCPFWGNVSYGYLWNTIPPRTTANITGLTPGFYCVTVTDLCGGCTVEACTTITEPDPLTGSVNPVAATCGLCNGALELNYTGGWTPPIDYYLVNVNQGGVPVPGTQGTITGVGVYTVTGLCAGEYSIVIEDAVPCTGDFGTWIVPNIGNCDDNDPCTTDACDPLDGSCTNTPIVCDDGDACTSDLCVNGTCEFTPVVLGVTLTPTDVQCLGNNDGTVTANVSGGQPPYVYVWINGGSGPTITGLSAGTYCVTVTDANGCTESACADVDHPLPLSGDMHLYHDCGGGCNGSFEFYYFNGGTLPFTLDLMYDNGIDPPYLLSSGDVFNNPPNSPFDPDLVYDFLCAGDYTLSMVDGNNCPFIFTTWTIAAVPEPAASASSLANVSCWPGCDGIAMVTGSGGTPLPPPNTYPYIYQWGNGQMGPVASGLCAGLHLVTVTDVNGCTTTADVQITEPAPFGLTTPDIIPATCGECDGSILLAPFGGTPGYTFLWSNGSSQQLLDGICDGLYTVTATDAHGCIAITSYQLGNTCKTTQPVAGVAATEGFRIYPNPFNSTTTIEFSLAVPDRVTLHVTDIAGKQIAMLLSNSAHKEGTYKVELLENLEPGVYFCTLIKEHATETIKIVKVSR